MEVCRQSIPCCLKAPKSLRWREDAQTKEIEASPPVHLPLQQFQARDLSFYLSLTPRKRQRRLNSGVIALDASSKSAQFH